MSSRSVTFTGIRFENPFLLFSAPPTESESNIIRAFDAGWGGVVTKTIGLHPVVNVAGAKTKFLRTSPEDTRVSMKKRDGAVLHSSWNWELISDKPLDWWVVRLRKIKDAHPGKVLIASIMAGSGNDKELRAWQTLATACQESGADGLELNFSCPHMDRKDMGSNIGRDEGLCSVVTEAVKEVATVPVPRRGMRVEETALEGEPRSEQCPERLRRMAEDRQAAAASRSVEREGREDDMAGGLKRGPEGVDVPLLVGRRGQEVKHGPVMPERVTAGGAKLENIAFDPGRLGGSGSESPLGGPERRGGDIEYREVGETGVQQVVDEGGGPAPDIENRGIGTETGGVDEFEGSVRNPLVPRNRGWVGGLVNLLPMILRLRWHAANLMLADVAQSAAHAAWRAYYGLNALWDAWLSGIAWNSARAQLGDARVRRALTLALNRPELARVLSLPDGVPAVDGPFTPRQLRRGELSKPLPYDPAQARALLDAAGWRQLGGNGVREREGRSFHFTLVIGGERASSQMAVYLQEAWRRVGIRADIETLDRNVLGRRVGDRQFDAGLSWPVVEKRWFGANSPLGHRNTQVVSLLERLPLVSDPAENDDIHRQLTAIFRSISRRRSCFREWQLCLPAGGSTG